ncbi:MAG: HAD family hydrolase [Verrucomicrobiales bacterium]
MPTPVKFIVLLLAWSLAAVADSLPSWNDTAAKQAIVSFVEKTTREGSPDFVPPADRIAVFDNDGTLWSEQPVYFQALFVFDRIRVLAPRHPEWKDQEPFASVLRGDVQGALAGGEHALLEMAMATHAGTTTEEFESIVIRWISTAKHPKTGLLYTQMVYQPMLELLAYLRANSFKTFIVSDGDFQMLEWTTTGPGSRFGLLVHHDDADREFAYDRTSPIGKLDRGLDEGPKRGWTIVSMKNAWKSIYPKTH